MALTRIIVNTPLTAAQDAANLKLNGTGSWYNVKRLVDWMRTFVNGSRSSNMLVKVSAIQAAGVVTFSGLPTADDTVTICNIVFTAKASASTAVQFTIGADATATGVNLAAKINAHTTVSKQVTASSALGVVTLTSVVPGLVGNGLQLSENANNTAVTAFAAGTDGTAYDLTLGNAIS